MLEILFVSDILLNTMAYSTQGKNTEYLYNTSLKFERNRTPEGFRRGMILKVILGQQNTILWTEFIIFSAASGSRVL